MATKHDAIERLYNSALKANQILIEENKRLLLKIKCLERQISEFEFYKENIIRGDK